MSLGGKWKEIKRPKNSVRSRIHNKQTIWLKRSVLADFNSINQQIHYYYVSSSELDWTELLYLAVTSRDIRHMEVNFTPSYSLTLNVLIGFEQADFSKEKLCYWDKMDEIKTGTDVENHNFKNKTIASAHKRRLKTFFFLSQNTINLGQSLSPVNGFSPHRKCCYLSSVKSISSFHRVTNYTEFHIQIFHKYI